jgi:hypothetical protein
LTPIPDISVNAMGSFSMDTFVDCAFYTWFGEGNPLQTMCFLFSSCDEVVACSGCSSGRPTCQPRTPQQCQQYWLLDDPTRNVEGTLELSIKH